MMTFEHRYEYGTKGHAYNMTINYTFFCGPLPPLTIEIIVQAYVGGGVGDGGSGMLYSTRIKLTLNMLIFI